MAKPVDSKEYTIGSLLGRYERRRVILPEFQRSYSWEKGQISTFWGDLILFSTEYAKLPSSASYFLGPIVLIEHADHLLLLDGQQRLATSIISLTAMRDVARSLDKKGLTKGGDLARDIQRELIEKEQDPVSYSLRLGDLDEPYFIKAIKLDPPVIPSTKMRSHSLIQIAYNIASEQIKYLINGKSYDDSIKIIKNLSDALTKGMALIGMIVKSEEDAYTIFETLNDRGLRLSVPDLVLNLLMRRANDDTARKLIRQHWNAMLRDLGKRDVSRFLRHLWVSRYGDLKAEGLFAAIKRELHSKKIDSVNFAELCAEECNDYVALLDVNVPLPSRQGNNDLLGIVKYLQIASAPPLLLAGYRSMNGNDFEKLLKAIITTQIRYVVISNKNPLDVETCFYETARLIRDSISNGESSDKCLSAAKKKLKTLVVLSKSLVKASDNITLERGEASWIMMMLANKLQSSTREVGMEKANLEHIFPQNASLAVWPNAVSLENLIWHIGNLTILGERKNRRAQNKSFKDKSSEYYSKSEIEMTKKLLRYSSWSEKEILDRGEELVRFADKLWPPL